MPRRTTDVSLSAADGLALNLVDFGGSGGPPLFFVHGSFGHAHVWDAVVGRLPPERRCLALDLPGHGDSAWAPGEARYGFDALVEDIHVAVGWLGERPVLAGHSIGSAIAMLYASKYSDRIAAAVLMDIDPHSPRRHADHLNEVGEAPPKVYPSFERAIARESRIAPGAAEEVHQTLARFGYRETEGGFAQKFDQGFLRSVRVWDMRGSLGKIAVPALVLRGSESTAMSVAGYDELLRAIPSARGLVIAGAGHQLHLDRPVEVAAAVDAFVTSLG